MIEFSIIIPTYDRINDLRDTLNSMKAQTLPTKYFEVIIIDSGTKGFENFMEEFNNCANFIFLANTEKGASIQRNIGVAKARGSYLVFIDDDANARPNWLEVYSQYTHLANFGVLAGKIIPLWSPKAKTWHKKSDYINNLYSMYDVGNEVKEIEYGFSCNYLIKKAALEAVGGFDPKHGRIGDERVLYGEDVVICQKINKSYKNYYIPNAIVDHKVLNYRLKWSWLIPRAYAGGLTKGLQNRKPKPHKKLKLSLADYFLLCFYILGLIRGTGQRLFSLF